VAKKFGFVGLSSQLKLVDLARFELATASADRSRRPLCSLHHRPNLLGDFTLVDVLAYFESLFDVGKHVAFAGEPDIQGRQQKDTHHQVRN
jgi:hypothetical protein